MPSYLMAFSDLIAERVLDSDVTVNHLELSNVLNVIKRYTNLVNNDYLSAFRRTVRRLRIANFRFHDLRHTAASWLRMSGADIHTVAQLLGHKDLRMAASTSILVLRF